jgi:hypothetical protein
VTYDLSPARRTFAGETASDRILQFRVVQGRQYTVRASGGAGSVGDYLLSLTMAVDDLPATASQPIAVDVSGATQSQLGSIETPGDTDRFHFIVPEDGYVVVAMYATQGTNLQGLLTFSPTDVSAEEVKSPTARIVVGFDQITVAPGEVLSVPVRLQAFAGVGWQEATRDNYVAIQVKQGRYEFLASADQNTIGDYRLALTFYPLRPGETQSVRFESRSEVPIDEKR